MFVHSAAIATLDWLLEPHGEWVSEWTSPHYFSACYFYYYTTGTVKSIPFILKHSQVHKTLLLFFQLSEILDEWINKEEMN